MSNAKSSLPTATKPSLAWFSPLPPDRTDIGHYTARILPALAEVADVALWTDTAHADVSLMRHATLHRIPHAAPVLELNRSDAARALTAAQQALGEMTTDEADVNVALFSALKKSGVGDAATLLHGWVHSAPGSNVPSGATQKQVQP